MGPPHGFPDAPAAARPVSWSGAGTRIEGIITELRYRTEADLDAEAATGDGELTLMPSGPLGDAGNGSGGGAPLLALEVIAHLSPAQPDTPSRPVTGPTGASAEQLAVEADVLSGHVEELRELLHDARRHLPDDLSRQVGAVLDAGPPATPPTRGISRIIGELARFGEGLRHVPVEGGELLAAAACYLEAATVARRATVDQATVARTLTDDYGIDPATDRDHQRMVENRARHYFGWDDTPQDWPWPAELWAPQPDAAGNLARAGALIAAEHARHTTNGPSGRGPSGPRSGS